MPILNVKVSGVASAERSQQIAQMLSQHTQEILNKKPELISIAISYIAVKRSQYRKNLVFIWI